MVNMDIENFMKFLLMELLITRKIKPIHYPIYLFVSKEKNEKS